MKISLACDHGALVLKARLKEYLTREGYELVDCGTNSLDSCDYPDFGYEACKLLQEGQVDRAIVMCTTGIGMSIVANKVKGVRCALVDKPEIAKITREHNDTNCLALGACLVDFETAKKIVDTWLTTPFSNGERHLRRVNKIAEIEAK